jgi:hypothetical protein
MANAHYTGMMNVCFDAVDIEIVTRKLAAEKSDGVGVALFQIHNKLHDLALEIAKNNTGGKAVLVKRWAFQDRASFTFSYDFRENITEGFMGLIA